MKRLYVLVAAVAVASLVVGMTAVTVAAQTSPPSPPVPPALGACLPGKPAIVASELPSTPERPGRRVFDLERCPIGGRPIVDHGVGSSLPEADHFVYAESVMTTGVQELQVTHDAGGTIVLQNVGDEQAMGESPGTVEAQATSPGACVDEGPVDDSGYILFSTLGWYFNRSSTPNYANFDITADAALTDIRQGGSNIASERNNCGFAEFTNPNLSYQESTSNGAGISADNTCLGGSFQSVVAFGDLPKNPDRIVLASTCNYGDSFRRQILESDVKFNKVDADWSTASPDFCRANTPNRFNLEAVMTHERGHTYGMLHAEPEDTHANLTMSPRHNGPCQNSEVNIGKGDYQLLRDKYQNTPAN